MMEEIQQKAKPVKRCTPLQKTKTNNKDTQKQQRHHNTLTSTLETQHTHSPQQECLKNARISQKCISNWNI